MAANTLTGLMPTAYEALDIVGRELTGFIPAVAKNSSAERLAVGQSVLVPVTQAAAAIDNTPAVAPPDPSGQTIDNVLIAITKSKSVPFAWSGEQQKAMRNAGIYGGIRLDQIAQAIRTLVNLVEYDCWVAAYQAASRAYGTAGTTPFGTAGDVSDGAMLRQILDDNGAPQTGLHLVGGSAMTAKLRSQSLLIKADEAGSPLFRRTGQISVEPIAGFMMHNSSAVAPVVKGTGSGYLANGAVAAGVNQIVLDTGTGTVLAGDVVTFGSDTNKYVVNTGVAAAGTIAIGKPGLRNTLADNTAMTIGGNYTPNVGFHEAAIQLVTRAPARPTDEDGRPLDLAEDVEILEDPYTGLAFELSMYRGWKQVMYYVGLAWGVNAIKSAHIATLIG